MKLWFESGSKAYEVVGRAFIVEDTSGHVCIRRISGELVAQTVGDDLWAVMPLVDDGLGAGLDRYKLQFQPGVRDRDAI